MLRRLDLRGDRLGPLADLQSALPRPNSSDADGSDGPLEAVRSIISDVRVRGDEAIREFTQFFDGATPPALEVAPSEMVAALGRIDPTVRNALEVAVEAITRHHEGQVRDSHTTEDAGLLVRSVSRPVERAGCYVPGGRAAYP